MSPPCTILPRRLSPWRCVLALLVGLPCACADHASPPSGRPPAPASNAARARAPGLPRRAHTRAAPAASVPARHAPRAPAAPLFAPCGAAPEGMVCIPGGPFLRGSDHHGRDARPQSRVVVGTFYLDRYEVTTPAFVACVQAGLCRPPKEHLRYLGFHGPTQPAVPVSWWNALSICLMLGKRLPTEAEWEKAARTTDGRTYPWGEEAPTCARAHVQGCKPAVTRPVGSLPPNPYGVYDMAGNGYEWVMDWYSPCFQGCKGACGPDCLGPDPRGPCGGAIRCPGARQRVLRGGSWYWSSTHARTVWRRPEYPESGGHRLSLRCATRNPSPRARDAAAVRALIARHESIPWPL